MGRAETARNGNRKEVSMRWIEFQEGAENLERAAVLDDSLGYKHVVDLAEDSTRQKLEQWLDRHYPGLPKHEA